MSSPPDTQQKSKIPLSDVSCTATGSVQWKLEKSEDDKTPVFNFNNLTVHICGEKSFKCIAEDIQAAEHSIDLAFWGFDPAMELIREVKDWPRGVTWGDLLRDAAQGKLNKSKRKVQVRLLVWHDTLGSAFAGNMPGYKSVGKYERQSPVIDPAVRARVEAQPHRNPAHPILAPRDLPTDQDKREMFNSAWWRDAVAGKIEGLSLRTRGGVNDAVMNSLKGEVSDRGVAPDATERISFELVATHHQKTIVIDYEGSNPRAYVMGLNSVTDYWDTEEHIFNDPRRGRSFEGDDKDHSVGNGWESGSSGQPSLKPYQDFVCRLEGDAVVAVCKNFTEAWNTARAEGSGAGSAINGRALDLKDPPKNLTRNLAAPFQRAQILRTMPAEEGSERSISRLYYQAGSFARNYIYIENQYFQNADWARALKQLRQDFVKGCAAAKVSMAELPVLHVMVVTPTPEHGFMVPRTHDIVTELGHGDSLPEQDKRIEEEIREHEAVQKARQRQRDPLLIPAPRPLSEIAKSHKEASGGKNSQAVRDALGKNLGMRTLVASLWTYDLEWTASRNPAFVKAKEDQARFDRELKEAEAASRRSTMPSPGLPLTPPPLPTQLNKARAQRYREIYIHSKLMIIDDSMFTLGSANLNLRSFAVDSEINIASDNAEKAKDLRQRVWKQHSKKFDGGGDAADQTVMSKTFDRWEKEAQDNFDLKKRGAPLSCSLVKFFDERSSSIRLG
jgi:phosphatidylserine/phosphatidylglycerophosphate/cardiolipin synthase-like enzyme